jgi:hypothetical protein
MDFARGAVGTIVLLVPETGFEPSFVLRGWFVLLPGTICTPFLGCGCRLQVVPRAG